MLYFDLKDATLLFTKNFKGNLINSFHDNDDKQHNLW